MDLYRRMAAVRTQQDADDLLDEIVDRFGDTPKGVLNLLDIALLRARAAAAGMTEIAQKGEALTFTLGAFDFAAIAELCAKPPYTGRTFFSAKLPAAITLRLKKGEDPLKLAKGLVADYAALRGKAE